MDQKPESKNTNDRHEDSFHSFMFGDRGVEANADIMNHQEHSKSTEDNPDAENRFSRDDWFLGKRNHKRAKKTVNMSIHK